MFRFALAILVAGIVGLPSALANDSSVISSYDPSVCAAGNDVTASRLERAVAAAESADCLAMMEAFPRPELERVPEDWRTLGLYSFWRVGPDAVALYDAPGGHVIGQMPAGFNFFNAINTSVEGWIQRVGGEWIRAEDTKPVNASRFTGMLLPHDWTHPYAIILDKTGTRASLRPGEPGSAESGYITRRYRLVNIFARTEDDAGKVWYLVGPQQWIRQELVAKFTPTERPQNVAGRWVAVDLFEQTLIAYEDDKPVFATVISSGMAEWPTAQGIFRVWARLPSDSMSGAVGQPDAYALQLVPWVLYFKGGQSLHGTYWHDSFGYRRSHGCVNLSISDARWIYDWMLDAEPNADGEIENQVYVFSSGVYASEAAAARAT
ncbi:MAG: L,D-transpeptidase [Chloroflexi bacterium]|nr:L,D-transpeptidase [Chloroflexota bacterium]